MTRQELLETIEEGVENGRISRHMAAYIAAEVLGVTVDETDFYDEDLAVPARRSGIAVRAKPQNGISAPLLSVA
jgi:hypothetical protein